MVAFAVLALAGLQSRSRCPPRRLLTLQASATITVIGVHWMAARAVTAPSFRHDEQIAVWVAVVTWFWFTTLHTVGTHSRPRVPGTATLVTTLTDLRIVVAITWAGGIAWLGIARSWTGWWPA